MTQRHFYLGIENLALTPPQKERLTDALKALGPPSHPQPARLCHWRPRLDNQAIILEALFNEDNLTITAFKQRLGAIFSIDPATIQHTVNTRSFSDGLTSIVTFSHTGTDYIRFALFGGTDATWLQSGDECRGYLATYRDQWEAPEE